MLLYVYVNLRLMNKISADTGGGMGGFLVDTLSNFDEEDIVQEEDLEAELMDFEEEVNYKRCVPHTQCTGRTGTTGRQRDV